MANIFEKSLPVHSPKHSVFELTRDYKTSFEMGSLIPVYLEEVLPGDRFKVKSDVMIRFAPMIAPIMDRVDVRLDYFFVPTRLCFDICTCSDGKRSLSFEDFITGGADGKAVAPMPSFIVTHEIDYNLGIFGKNKLLDYFGFMPHFDSGSKVVPAGSIVTIPNLTPVLAYQLICDNFYRDQTFSDSISDFLKNNALFDSETGYFYPSTSEWPVVEKMFSLRNRLFSKDYFTTAMPAPQRGDSVYLMNPLAISANLSDDTHVKSANSQQFFQWPTGFGIPRLAFNDNTPVPSDGVNVSVAGVPETDFAQLYGASPAGAKLLKWKEALNKPYFKVSNNPSSENYLSVEGDVDVDIESGGEGITINDFFTLQSIQRWLNHNQNFGGRYVEQLVGHFGVVPSDARLNLPEYLGGGKAPIMISEVLQTALTSDDGTTSDDGVGEMSGHGIAFGKTGYFSRFFNEHGLILGLLSVTPKNSYTTAVPKIFFKNDKFDFAFPEFANIGEQAIKNKEIYLQVDGEDNEGTFGYTPRYSEYRVGLSLATGDFRDDLSYWHLARVFDSLPTLSESFLKVTDDNTKRIFQNQSGTSPHIYCDVFHHVTGIRPLPLLPNTSLL